MHSIVRAMYHSIFVAAMSVQVRGVASLTSSELLQQYLSNTRRSGGGRLVDAETVIRTAWNWGSLTFADAKGKLAELRRSIRSLWLDPASLLAVDGVLAKQEHVLEGKQLYVTKLPPISRDSVFLENVPEWADMNFFKFYITAIARAPVRDIRPRSDGHGALILFARDVDC